MLSTSLDHRGKLQYSVTGHMTRPHSASLVAHKAEEIHYEVELTDKAIKLISSCQLVINAVDERRLGDLWRLNQRSEFKR